MIFYVIDKNSTFPSRQLHNFESVRKFVLMFKEGEKAKTQSDMATSTGTEESFTLTKIKRKVKEKRKFSSV